MTVTSIYEYLGFFNTLMRKAFHKHEKDKGEKMPQLGQLRLYRDRIRAHFQDDMEHDCAAKDYIDIANYAMLAYREMDIEEIFVENPRLKKVKSK